MSLPTPIATPFPHLVLDNFVDPLDLYSIVREFPRPDDPRWRRYGNEREVKLEGPREMWGPETERYFEALAAFAPDLGRAFGIEGLTMETIGGGYHLIPPGGRLAVHTDFNRSPDSGLYRRLNFLTYLNHGDWYDPGGRLQLGVGEGRKLVAPTFGRTVIFETSDVSWHGHPVPTERRWRLSVAAYFFSPDPPPGYSGEHSTVWGDDA